MQKHLYVLVTSAPSLVPTIVVPPPTRVEVFNTYLMRDYLMGCLLLVSKEMEWHFIISRALETIQLNSPYFAVEKLR